MNRILIIESDNRFFFDQLKIEGINAGHETGFNSAVKSEAEIIVFNNVCISEKELKEFPAFFQKKTKLVFLNPCIHVIEYFELKKGSLKTKNYAMIGNIPIQILNSKEFVPSFPYANALNDGFEGFLIGSPIQPVFRKYV